MEKSHYEIAIDRIFSMDRSKLILLCLFIVGLILRIIAAVNISVSADDMHHVIHAINFYGAGRLITYDQSAGLWHSLTSLVYNIFGVGQFTSRLIIILFGTASIFAVYLLSSEFFTKRIAMLSAFLATISPFAIKLTVGEMDVMAVFFMLCSMIFFIKALKSNHKYLFFISGISIGLALYTKVYPFLFIPSMLIYFCMYQRKMSKKIITKENIYKLSIFLVTAFIFAIPTLTHNYLLYTEKGFVDLQFTRSLGIGKDISEKYYGWDHQFNAKNDWSGLFFGKSSNYGNLPTPTLWVSINYIRLANPLVFYLSILAIISIFFYKENKEYLKFFGLSILFALPFLASIILLPKHYLFLETLMIPLAAKSLIDLSDKIKSKFNFKSLKLFVLFSIIISFIWLGLPSTGTTNHFFGRSAVDQFIDFKDEKISQNSLIIADSRIYRGQTHWLAYGRPYVEAANFIEFLNVQDKLPGRSLDMPVYFIECVSDDCGWGTIKDQPELNNTMEGLVEAFAERGILIKEIDEPDKDLSYYPFQESKQKSRFNVYLASIPLKEPVLTFASQPKEWFLYEIGYKNKDTQFDSFKTTSFLSKTLYNLARTIVLISMILSLILFIYLIFSVLSIRSESQSNTN